MSNRTTPHVVAICGSVRDESRTRVAADIALTAAAEGGATTALVDYAGVTNYPELSQQTAVQTTDCRTDD